MERTKLPLIERLDLGNTLGEGVVWDKERECIWWTDIQESTLYRYSPRDQALKTWRTPHRLCSFGLIAGSDTLIAAFDDGFAWYHPESSSLEWIQKTGLDQPGTRLNDGRVDRQGRFWAGGMTEDGGPGSGTGSLFCLHRDLSVNETLTGIGISNSLCWSPDSRYLYHCDTPQQRIDIYDFNEQDATLVAASTLAETTAHCFPDGSTVDSEGYIWNAQWGGGQLVRYAPDGRIDAIIEVPASQVTCVAFGGPALDQLIVTSANEDLDPNQLAAEPEAGSLFIYQAGVSGLPECTFKPEQPIPNFEGRTT